MDTLDAARCRQILELSPSASLEEIHFAYQRLKRLYEDDRSPFLPPSMDEFSAECRNDILAELEAAHRELCRGFEAAHPQPQRIPIPILSEAQLPMDGPSLQKLREASGTTLEYLTSQIHIRPEILQALEEERFEDLPHAIVNVRGFLTAYVTELGLPPEVIVAGYMQRYQQWRDRHAPR